MILTENFLVYRLEALPEIAEKELSCAAKDISNAGILGTISIMLENSGKGGEIYIDAIPKPSSIDLIDWIHCFQSFGFILVVKPGHVQKVQEVFAKREIDAAIVRKVTSLPVVSIAKGGKKKILFDFEDDEITGISYSDR